MTTQSTSNKWTDVTVWELAGFGIKCMLATFVLSIPVLLLMSGMYFLKNMH